MYNFFSKLNVSTLETVAPYFSTSTEPVHFYSIFPHLIFDLYILKPALFKNEYKGAFVLAMTDKSVIPTREAFLEESLAARLEDAIKTRVQSDEALPGPTILSHIESVFERDRYSVRPPKPISINPSFLRLSNIDFNGVRLVCFGTRLVELLPDFTLQIRKIRDNEEVHSIEANTRIGISFLDALLVSHLLALLSKEEQKHFRLHWKTILPFIPEWRMGYEISSALASSSLSTYMSQLRVFSTWITSDEVPSEMRRECFEHVLYDLKTNQLTLNDFQSYMHYRDITVSFRTVRASFSGLGFFYRQIHFKSLLEMFPALKVNLKNLQKKEEAGPRGSIALSFALLTKLLDFVHKEYESDKYDSAVLYNLYIIAFWFMLRIGEAARLSFPSCLLYRDPVLDVEKLRLTLIHPKTGSTNYPDQFVTCSAIPNNPLCPIAAFKRLQLIALENQVAVFANSKGKPLGVSNIGSAFADVREQWKLVCPDVPEGKLTFHTFRISSIGYHAIDLGLSIFEVQAISRHRYGSAVTQDVYLAKSQALITEQTATKVAEKINALDDPLKPSEKPELGWMKYLSLPTQRIFQTWRCM